ncbi:MAG: STN domain-containing protein [Planctomycetota bacterium]
MVERLQQIGDVSVWIDRRVDPYVELNHQAEDQPLDEVLDAAVSSHGWRAVRFGGCLYVGPKETAEALPALASALRSEIPKPRGQWTKRLPRATPRGAEPRKILGETLSEVRTGLTNPEAIPFDIWPERNAGSSTLVELTVLVLAGFDMRAEVSDAGRSLKAVPIDYASLGSEGIPAKRRRPVKRANGAGRSRVYTLRIREQPLKPIVEQLAESTKRLVRWERSIAAAGLRTDVRVSIDVEQATFDELLAALLEETSLRHRLEDGAIVIEPAN